MLEKKILEEVLQASLATGGDFAEIFEETTYSNRYAMLNGVVENANSGIRYGIGLRIYHDVQSVYAYTSDTSIENLMKTARTLAASIQGEGKNTCVELKEVIYENAHPIKKMPRDYPADVKIALMQEANDAALAYDPVIKKVMTSYFDEEQHVAISNSKGRYIQDVRVRTRLSVDAIAMDKELLESGSSRPGGSSGLEFYETHQPKDVGMEAARIAKTMLYADDCPSGVMSVVIDNGFGGVIFHEACGHSLEAAAIAKNQSVFCGKMGQKIASDCVSAIDDGTIPNAWGSANIDDEGNFTKRNVLIKDGILQSYLVDTLNGLRMDTPSTSSARRESYQYAPVSRMTNTFIANGTDTLEDIIKDTKYGLYAKSMGGGSVTPTTGDYNFSVREAYIIKDGVIGKPVKGATLIGNGSDTLLKIDRVGNNLACDQGMCGASSGSIPTDVGQPVIRVTEMIVGGKDGGNHNG